MASSDPRPSARAIRIDGGDNVATLLDDAVPGPVTVLGGGARAVEAMEPMAAGHKIALAPIAAGQAVVKYGLSIGHAIDDIAPGAWVHLHNLASNYDERSSTLDGVTGAPTDTTDAYR
jgi:altronate dehydratase small subunit